MNFESCALSLCVCGKIDVRVGNLKVGRVTVTVTVIMITTTLQCHRLTIDNLRRPIIHRQTQKQLNESFLTAYGH